MNGVHDLGGMHGFGPVAIEPDEPVFHHDWERRTFAVVLATRMAGHWNIDQSRFAREQMPPASYLAATYYERWLWGVQRLLDERGLVARQEVASRMKDPAAGAGTANGAVAVTVEDLAGPAGPNPSKVDADVPPRFRVGERVLARQINPTGHTRLPRYVRGKRGTIMADHGVWALPDASAAGLGQNAQHCYSVRFEARELWGDGAAPGDGVYVDLWDDYLERP